MSEAITKLEARIAAEQEKAKRWRAFAEVAQDPIFKISAQLIIIQSQAGKTWRLFRGPTPGSWHLHSSGRPHEIYLVATWEQVVATLLAGEFSPTEITAYTANGSREFDLR